MKPRRITKRLKKAQERFKSAVTEYLLGLGAQRGGLYDYALYTPAGVLQLAVYDNWIATRFDDLALGKAFSESCNRPCNPYSGKWNFHFCDDTELLDPKTVLPLLTYYFDQLMAWKTEEATAQ